MAVSKLNTKALSEIKGITLKYPDNTFSLDKEHYSTSDGFEFNLYKAFDNYNDLTINNYSCFILGKKDKFSNWGTYESKENKISSYITTIKFNQSYDSTTENYLYFEKETSNYSIKSRNNLINVNIDLNKLDNYPEFWYIVDIIDGTNQCYIKHNINGQNFYLYNRKYYQDEDKNIIYSDDIAFTSDFSLAQEFGKFNFIKTNNNLLLFQDEQDSVLCELQDTIIIDVDHSISSVWLNAKHNLEQIDENFYKIKNADSQKYQDLYHVDPLLVGKIVSIASDNGKYICRRFRSLSLDNNGEIKLINNNNLLPIVDFEGKTYNVLLSVLSLSEFINSEKYIDTSWISFADKSAINVNLDKSAFNLDSQCLFHFQYNNIDKEYTVPINFIPLKNHLSIQNRAIRGDYMDNTEVNKPNINFREYTSLETGSNQEFGTSNIVLNYVYYDTEFSVNEGEDLSFKIIANSDEFSENNRDSALYPFINININDTNFIQNGSFGSTIPFLADKVKKLQNNSKFVNNGQYLYTWLYQSEDEPYGIWLDRYYYPNKITKRKLLTQPFNIDQLVSGSFTDIIDSKYLYNDDENDDINLMDKVQDLNYFDKKSDLVFEADTQYIYSRVGKQDFESILNDIKDYKEDVSTSYNGLTDDFIKVNSNNFKQNGVLDFNFDMHLSSDKDYGTFILGSSPNYGLSVRNSYNISPFKYIFHNEFSEENKDKLIYSRLSLLNENNEEIKFIDFIELFENNEKIEKLILTEPFNDFVTITDKAFYVLGYDLYIKERYLLDEIFKFNNQNYKIISGYIHNNIVYFTVSIEEKIEEKNIEILKRILKFDIKEGKITNEICRYSPTSILGKTSNGTIISIDRNCLNDFVDNEYVVKPESENNEYVIPYGINSGDIITLISDKPVYDPNYWYYSPIFENDTNYDNSIFIKHVVYFNDCLYGLPYEYYSFTERKNIILGSRLSKVNLHQIEEIDITSYKELKNDMINDNILFSSYGNILNLSYCQNGNFAILRFNNNSEQNELLLFDKTKKLRLTVDLSKYEEIMGLDTIIINNINYIILFVKYFDEEEQKYFYQQLAFDENFGLNTTYVYYIIDKEIEKVINYSEILKISTKNNINFILSLPIKNALIERYVYSLDISKIIPNWYNFRIIVDLNKGIFEVYQDNILLTPSHSVDINEYTYNDKNIFNYPLIIGTCPYKNGILLSEFLKLDKEYFRSSVKLKNISLYSKILKYFERQSLLLNDVKIHPLTFTLPAGQKNNLDEIIRFFKYNPPGNMSNNIRINIQNSKVTNIIEQRSLAKDILSKINKELAIPVNISEINFY